MGFFYIYISICVRESSLIRSLVNNDEINELKQQQQRNSFKQQRTKDSLIYFNFKNHSLLHFSWQFLKFRRFCAKISSGLTTRQFASLLFFFIYNRSSFSSVYGRRRKTKLRIFSSEIKSCDYLRTLWKMLNFIVYCWFYSQCGISAKSSFVFRKQQFFWATVMVLDRILSWQTFQNSIRSTQQFEFLIQKYPCDFR